MSQTERQKYAYICKKNRDYYTAIMNYVRPSLLISDDGDSESDIELISQCDAAMILLIDKYSKIRKTSFSSPLFVRAMYYAGIYHKYTNDNTTAEGRRPSLEELTDAYEALLVEGRKHVKLENYGKKCQERSK